VGVEFLGLKTFRLEDPHPFISNLPDTMQLLRETGRPNVGVVLDSYHFFTSQGTLAQVRALRGSDIVHMHVNDAPHADVSRLTDSDRVLPGLGVIDLVGLFKAVAEIGYNGYMAIEIFDQRFREQDRRTAVRIAKEALDSVLRQVRSKEKA